jgi:hypothetical protein
MITWRINLDGTTRANHDLHQPNCGGVGYIAPCLASESPPTVGYQECEGLSCTSQLVLSHVEKLRVAVSDTRSLGNARRLTQYAVYLS